jgi:hypothetical protein
VFKYSTNTTISDPGSGYFRLSQIWSDTSNQLIALNDITFYPGANIGSLWDLITSQGLINTVLKFVKVDDSTVYKYLRIYDFNSRTDWEEFTVEVIAVGGSAGNDDQFLLEIGIAGSRGTSGSSGSSGTPGSSGSSGSSGINGTSGSSGTSGINGTSGSSGSSGSSGTSGTSGNSGSSGSSGTSGTSGTSGLSGSSGTNGTSGSSGTSGGLTASSYVVQGRLSTDQTIPSRSDTVIQFIDDFDPNNWWDASTYRFTPTVAGYYNVTLDVLWAEGTSTTDQYNVQTRKNGNQVFIWQNQIPSSVGISQGNTKIIYLNGSTDYVDFTAYNGNTGDVIIRGSGAGSTSYFSASLIVGGFGSSTGGTGGSSGSSGSSGTSGSSGINGTSGSSGTSGINGTSGSSGSSGLLGSVFAGYGKPVVVQPDGIYAFCDNMYQYNGGGVVFNGRPNSVSGRTELGYEVVTFTGIDYLLPSQTVFPQNAGGGRIQDFITSGTIGAGKLCYLTTTVGGIPYDETTRMALTDSDSASSSTGLLAICLLPSTGDDQVRPFALNGYVNVESAFISNKSGAPTDDNGKPVYVGTTSGQYDMLPPSGTGKIVRIVGHVIAAGGSNYLIYFRPDNSWIEL